MKILITGGAGFIGSHLANRLVFDKHHVMVLDSFSRKIHGVPYTNSSLVRSLSRSVSVRKGDIRHFTEIRRALVSADTVVHFAAETGTGQSMYKIRHYYDTNVQGTAALCECLVSDKHQVKKIVLASSRAVYGEGAYTCATCGVVFPDGRTEQDCVAGIFNPRCPLCQAIAKSVPTAETAAIKPSSIYAASKYSQEQLLTVTCRAIGIPLVILRYQNVYGAGQSLINPYTGILAIFSNLVRQRLPIDIFEDGMESRDFINILDATEATATSVVEREVRDVVINIGSGAAITVLEIARLVKKYLGGSSAMNITGNYRIGDIRHNVADIATAKRLLGFAPKVSIDNGIRSFCAWVKNQKIPCDRFSASIAEIRKSGFFKEHNDCITHEKNHR
jgi:dTDP-L-rhamnose 4-epimerase